MTETDVLCDCCAKLMYRASSGGVKYTPGATRRPIVVTIGVRRFMFCSRGCLINTVRGMSHDELTAGTGYPLPWGWPSGVEEKPVGEG